MEKSDRETHDFMNVESFSQLPFIRPSPLKEKAIRLFGKDFVGGAGGSSSDSAAATDEFDTNDNTAAVADRSDRDEFKETSENSRKFECHYCCRNFPTSQALGGHQNAHKRERQHAKRAHLQSTMVNGSYSEAHMYATASTLMNYHRFATATPPSFYPHHHHNTTTNTTNNHRFYTSINGTNSHNQTPINGNPLALWRSYPNAQNATYNRHHLININPTTTPMMVSPSDQGLRGSRIQTNTSYIYDQSKPSVQDQVSLDLRL